MTLTLKYLDFSLPALAMRELLLSLLAPILILTAAGAHGAMLYKDYVVRYDRGWDILCDPYQVQEGDWVLKILRQKGEIAHEDFREFLGIFQRLNPHVKDIDRIRPGQVVDIPLKKLAQGVLPGQASGVVTIPFVIVNNPREMIEKHTQTYTIQKGDTVSTLIAKQFGGRFGNTTYEQGLKLFQAVNPQIKNINRIYAGQKIYMPDPSIRQQNWYDALFDDAGNLVQEIADTAATERAAPPAQAGVAAAPQSAAAPQTAVAPPAAQQAVPAAEVASVIGSRLLDKGTYFLPMQQGGEFELDLSRYPMIDLQNGSKVVLTSQDQMMNVDLASIQSYWNNIKVVKVNEKASSQEILEAILAAISGDPTSNRLAFDDQGVSVSVSAKWIRSAPSADGQVLRHTCFTPIASAAQQTDAAIIRYLDQNDIVIKDIINGASAADPSPRAGVLAAQDTRLDASSQKSLVESFAHLMGFHYSPNTSISFPYAGIQVQALSNLLSFGNGKELLVDFGDLYGDALKAIRDTGLEILQIEGNAGPLQVIQRLMETAGMAYTASPVFYGADRSSDFNTAITVDGILIPTDRGENRLFTKAQMPELIDVFIRSQGIRVVRIDKDAAKK